LVSYTLRRLKDGKEVIRIITKASDSELAGSAKMKASLFKEMMAGFDQAVKHPCGRKARVRVSRFSPAVVVLKPKDIRATFSCM
jgi:hypothetical protein